MFIYLEENTIIIYLSDNGPNSWRCNGGMKGRKGSTDEGGVRVPIFIKWDGVLHPGKKIEEIAGVIDLLPTLADLTGIEFQPKKKMDGIVCKRFQTSEYGNLPFKKRRRSFNAESDRYSRWAGDGFQVAGFKKNLNSPEKLISS
ncbi:MAG: sulfatase-like hydrolase/transferase [Mariniphaga sp.]|nr:sulfatase-like hydrolase/transferase [Mariniphaga sp.]